MKKIIGIGAVLFIILCILLWVTNEEKVIKKEINSTEITIGAVLPLSGKVSSYGLDSKKGIDLAIKLINDSQNKYFFKCIYQDSKGEPKTAVSGLKKLINTSKPLAIIGENISSSTGAMIPIIDKEKMILISPSASAPNLSGLSKYFFRVFPSDDEEGAFIAEVIVKQHPKGKVALLYINNDYGIGLKNAFVKTAKMKKLKILSVNAFNSDMKNITSILLKIKNEQPDAIYMPSYYENGARIVKKIKELGFDVNLYGSTTHEDDKFLKISKNTSEGFQYPMSTGYDENSNNEYIQSFVTNYKNLYNRQPGLVSALAYDSAQLIINAVIKKGASLEDIRSYILHTKNIRGVAGDMNFDDSGNVHKKIILKIVHGGKFVQK